MADIVVELVTLDGVKFKETVHEAILPTPDGQIAVFKDHAQLVTLAAPGVVRIRRKANEPDDFMEAFAIAGGVIEITNNHVRVLVDEADNSDEVNEEKAKEALANARKQYAQAADKTSLDKAQSLIDRQAARLQIASLKRRKSRR